MHIWWLSKRKQWLWWGGLILFGLSILIVLIGGYVFHWGWTGFNKSLWDWMQLLIVPAALAVAGFLLTRAEHRREQVAEQQKAEIEHQATEQKTQWERHFAEQRAVTERSIAQWRLETEIQQKEEYQRETLLQAYFDRMEVLLIDKGLRHSESGDEVRMTARARTLTTLQRLDLTRKTEVFWFLYESGLLGGQNTGRIVDVSDVDWSSIQLNGVQLEQIDLSDVDLSRASMQETNLREANLEGATLCQADIQGANLRGVKLQNADLTQADLTGADLTNANLRGAQLIQACLKQATLCNSNLRNAVLQRADLSRANLQGAHYTEEQLATAYASRSTLR